MSDNISSFRSPAGLALIRRLLSSRVPYPLHDHQVEGTGVLLDRVDLVAVLETGAGKTAYFFLPVLFIKALHEDDDIPEAMKKKFPANPVVFTIVPTNNLELEKVHHISIFSMFLRTYTNYHVPYRKLSFENSV